MHSETLRLHDHFIYKTRRRRTVGDALVVADSALRRHHYRRAMSEGIAAQEDGSIIKTVTEW